EAALATIYAKEQIIKKLEQQLADNKKKDDFLCQHKEIEVKLIIEDSISDNIDLSEDAEELGINILDDIEKTGIETWIKEMLIIYDNKKTNTNKTPQQQSDLDTKKQQLKDLENKQKELEKPLDLTVLITKLQSEIKQLEKKTNRTEAEENSLQIKKKQLAELLAKQNNKFYCFLTNEIPVSESNINNDEEEEKD
ncbi:22839_t:CDS:2, partial [Entrophospora sp. SA101]